MLRANPARWELLRLTALLMLLTPLTAWGLDNDRNQPIQIEADRAMLHEQGNKSIYEGNVLLRQGSLQLQGDYMTVLLRDKQVDKIILTGKPASLKKGQNSHNTDKRAEADNIEYSAIDERVILLGHARIWQASNQEFRSERIVLNLKDNTVNAGGTSSQDRVHITLQPKKQAGE